MSEPLPTMEELARRELHQMAKGIEVFSKSLSLIEDQLHIFLQGMAAYGPGVPGPGRLVDAKLELERICGELLGVARDIRPDE